MRVRRFSLIASLMLAAFATATQRAAAQGGNKQVINPPNFPSPQLKRPLNGNLKLLVTGFVACHRRAFNYRWCSPPNLNVLIYKRIS